MSKLILGLLLGFLFGFNVGGQGNTLDHLWPKDRDGLRKLNARMKSDKSERIAAVFMTRQSQYVVADIDLEKNDLHCEIKKVPEDQLETRWKQVHGVKS